MASEPQTFGEPFAFSRAFAHYFRLRFRTENLALRWSHCSSTANFVSSYYRGVFQPEYTPVELNDLTHSIAYLANELLENAVKFRAPGDVQLEAGVAEGEFVLHLTNLISAETSARFQALLAEITAGDAGEMLLERIEANAAEENSSGSGLGILTLINDYGVRFCWTFSAPSTGEPGSVELSTSARLRLPECQPR